MLLSVIASKQLGSILSALSRPSDEDSVGNLVRRFDPDNCGKIAWDNQELLLVIALMDVEDAKKIEDSIFSVGFKTFSKVLINDPIYSAILKEFLCRRVMVS